MRGMIFTAVVTGVIAAGTAAAVVASHASHGAHAAQARQATPPAELVLRNGRIVTVDARLPEAQAMAASGGKIVAIGSNADIARYVGASTQVIDLNGQLAIPGFVEGHAHFTGIGES